MKKILFNCQIVNNNNFDIVLIDNVKDNDNDFVIYKDKVNDIVIVNDFVNNDNVNVYNDINIVNVLKGLNDNDNVIKNCYNTLDNIYNDIDNVFVIDNDNIIVNDNVYVNKIDKVNVNDIKNIVNNIIDNDNVYLYINNTNDIDNDNDYVLLSMNKDIYNDNYYDLFNYIKLSYVKYNYDNDNVKVIIDLNNLNFVLSNLNHVYRQIKYLKSFNFYSNEIIKNNNDFDKAKSLYIDLINKKSKDKKRLNYLCKVGLSKQRNIKNYQLKLNRLNKTMTLDFYKQYIIKNNCFYNDLNKLKNKVYKSFKDNIIDKDLINDIKNIDKDNVNVNYKYDNKIDNDFDFKIVIDNDNFIDFDSYIDYNSFNFNVYEKRINDIVNDYNNIINKVLKDISYDLNKEITFKNVINDIDFDILSYTLKLDKVNKLLDNDKDNDIVKNNFNTIYVIINYLKTIKEYLIDFDIDLLDYDIDNDKEYSLYNFDIYKSPMNKHNSIIRKKQSDFLKIAYDKDLKDFVTTD